MISISVLALLTAFPFMQEMEGGTETFRNPSSMAKGVRFEDGDVPESPPGERFRRFGISMKIETGQESQRITDSHNNFGADRTTLERNLSLNGNYTDALVGADLWVPLSSECALKLNVSLGGEQLVSHFRIGADNTVLGDPAGVTAQDFNYGLGLVWGLGAEGRYQIDATALDVTVSVDYRAGGDNEKDALTEDEYHYWRIRGGAFAGWKVSENVRLYAGLHYTYYRAKFRLKDSTTGQDFTLDLAYDNPVDVALGLELTAGPVFGGVEIDVLGSLSVLVSAGVRF